MKKSIHQQRAETKISHFLGSEDDYATTGNTLLRRVMDRTLDRLKDENVDPWVAARIGNGVLALDCSIADPESESPIVPVNTGTYASAVRVDGWYQELPEGARPVNLVFESTTEELLPSQLNFVTDLPHSEAA